MPYLLRKISKSRWHLDDSWLSEGEFQSDSLNDIETKNNQLSVFWIDDDFSNLNRVLAALGANTKFNSNIDYALIRTDVIENQNIKFKISDGDLPDEYVNAKWHRDVYELTASARLRLASSIQFLGERKRIGDKQILELVVTGIAKGEINRNNLKWEGSSLAKIETILSTK